MSFNDDERIVAKPDEGPRPIPIVAGRVDLSIKNNSMAPLEQNNQKVLLELKGGSQVKDRAGLDLVAVLDVSGSMQGDKIENMKLAMQFVIKKLSPIDRLSIVSFSSGAHRLCPLRQVTEASQPELQGIVRALRAGGGTNITEGLNTALKVLNNRTFGGGRAIGVMLMSDGEQNRGGDAATVTIGNVPVYTFGFGANYDPTVLNAVAKNSKGGTFYVVTDERGLGIAFSQCLAGLLTIVVYDLRLKVMGIDNDSTIQKVTAGSYPQTVDDSDGSIEINFGDLYSMEVRKVIVDLVLPPVDKERGTEMLSVTYKYVVPVTLKSFEPTPAIVAVRRTGRVDDDQADVPEVQTEEARHNTASAIKDARTMADDNKLPDARDKLIDAQNALEDLAEQSNPLVDGLREELQQLHRLFRTPEMYQKEGRPFALSSETSHDRQRFAARGDVDSMRLFATPRMDTYLQQAKDFDNDPDVPLPSADEDVQQELLKDPLAAVAGPIGFYIKAAIDALEAIRNLLNNGGKA